MLGACYITHTGIAANAQYDYCHALALNSGNSRKLFPTIENKLRDSNPRISISIPCGATDLLYNVNISIIFFLLFYFLAILTLLVDYIQCFLVLSIILLIFITVKVTT